jgi:hypothetical protein
MKAIQSEYYGDNTRWFVADVIDHTPPYGLEGRVKIRIHGVHNPSTREITQNDLPWAQLVLPTTEGGVSGLGSTPRVVSGSTVFGFFMDGAASQIPLVLGTIPKTELPTRVQRGVVYNTVQERINQKETFFQQEVGIVNNDAVEDENGDLVFGNTLKARQQETIKFFLNSGYTLNQSIGILAGLVFKSNLSNIAVVGESEFNPLGLAGWTKTRKTNLRNFSNDWSRFSTQLVFVKYELNSSVATANIKLKQSNTLEKDKPNNCQRTFAKYYLGIKKESEFSSIEKITLTLQKELGV